MRGHNCNWGSCVSNQAHTHAPPQPQPQWLGVRVRFRVRVRVRVPSDAVIDAALQAWLEGVWADADQACSLPPRLLIRLSDVPFWGP